jgi:hypothetical protein
MKILIPFLTVLMIVFVSGCSSVTVKTDYDRTVDFSKFKTYRWASGKQINPDDELEKRPLVEKRIKRAVDQVLKEKGYVKADSGSADFTVLVHAGVKEKMQVTDWGYHGWYDPWWGPYGGRVDVSTYEEGTLVIDIVDMSTKELAWRGMATGIVHDYDSQEDMEAAALVVSQKILKDFPPPPQKM